MTSSFNKSATGIGRVFKALGLGAITAGIVRFGKSAIDAASDLQEWQNVVDVAFGNAKDQANQLADIAIKKFGVSGLAAKKMAGTFMAMADGVGLANDAGAKMAIQLTGLSADMASFYNTTTETTSNALEAIFTGQSRALKQFGVVMSEANLEAFRMARGITTAYSAMNEAQRVALRYNYVLSVTRNAQNDYARTAMSWANQMRLLTNNWNVLITKVGQGLMKVLVPVVAILNKILSLAIAVVNAIAKVFGGKGISGISSGTDAMQDFGGSVDDTADAFDGATAAAKKYKATVAGFDELERLNGVDDSGSGGSGAGGLGGGGVGVDDLDSYFDLFDEDGILNKFEEFFQKLKDLWDAGDFEGIGREIAGVLNNLMQMLDDWIVNKFEPWGVKWAEITARILNGVVEAFNWELLGKTIGDGLNAIIHICNKFLETFNSLALGEGIGRAVNSWFSTVDWEGLGHFFANKLNFIIDVVAGFFDKFIEQAYVNGQKLGEAFNAFVDWIHWDNLSRAIWEGLNSIGEVIQGFVDMVDWETLKTKVTTALQDIFDNLDIEGIKTAVSGLVDNIMDFLLEIDWYQIGYTVGEMLSGVDWLGVLMDVKDRIIWPAWKGFWDGLMADGKNLLLGWVGKIGTWFEKSFFGPIVKTILGILVGNTVLGAIRGFFTGGDNKSLFGAIVDSMTWVITSIGGLVPGWGKEWGELFGGAFKFDAEKLGLGTAFKELFTSTIPSALSSAGAAFGGFMESVSAIAGPLAIVIAAVLSLTSSYGGLGGVLKRVGKVFSDTVKHVKDFADKIGFSEKIEKLKDAFGHLVEPLKRIYDVLGLLKPVWEFLFTTITGALTIALDTVVGLVGGLAETLAGLVDIIAGVLGLIVDLFTLNFTNLDNDIRTIWNGIVEFFQGIWDTIIGAIGGFVQGVIDWFADLKYNLIGDPIVLDLVDGVIQAFLGMFESILLSVQEWIESVIQFFLDLKAKAEEVFEAIRLKLEEIWTAVKQFAMDTWIAIKDFLAQKWEEIKQKTEEIWNAILEWLRQTWENLKQLTMQTWEWLKQTIQNAWNWIKETTATIWTNIKQWLSDLWEKIKTLCHDAVEWVKKTVSDAWEKLKETTSRIWTNIKEKISKIWEDIKSKASSITESIKDYFVKAYDRITGVWDKFKSFWHGVWDGAAGVVKSAINGVIGVINRFHMTNPFTGESFGFNIPKLARGGVITSPTVAMMGEYTGARSNPEIVAPQSLLKEIISSENGEMVDALYQIATQIISAIQDVDMSVSIGDDQIAQAANRGNNNYRKRTGKPLFSI